MMSSKIKSVESVGHYFNLKNKEYCNQVLRFLEREDKNTVVEIFSNYLPGDIDLSWFFITVFFASRKQDGFIVEK